MGMANPNLGHLTWKQPLGLDLIRTLPKLTLLLIPPDRPGLPARTPDRPANSPVSTLDPLASTLDPVLATQDLLGTLALPLLDTTATVLPTLAIPVA